MMLDDLAVYLVLAPTFFTVALVALGGVWMTRRNLAAIRLPRRRRNS